jgi:hypothetical protein
VSGPKSSLFVAVIITVSIKITPCLDSLGHSKKHSWILLRITIPVLQLYLTNDIGSTTELAKLTIEESKYLTVSVGWLNILVTTANNAAPTTSTQPTPTPNLAGSPIAV